MSTEKSVADTAGITLSEEQRSREERALHYDVVVIGGGLAGVSAAIMAARLGCRTALIQDRPVLGGNSSSEVRCVLLGADCIGSNRHARESGILEELQLESRYRDAVGRKWHPDWDWLLWEWVTREEKLDLYLNSCAAYAWMAESPHIDSVSVYQTSTGRRYRFTAPVFIDASGDGAVAASAGAEYRFGREGRDELGESLAPEEADRKVQPSAISFIAQDEGRPVSFTPPAWARVFADDASLRFRDHSRVGRGFWWLEHGGDLDTADDAEKIRDELLKILYGIWDHIKNRGDHGAENLSLEWISAVIGKRESRRFVGDYILNQNDIEMQRLFEDRVAYGGWPFDVHAPEGIDHRAPPSLIRVKGYPWGTLNSLSPDASHNWPGVVLTGMGYSLDPEFMLPEDVSGLIPPPAGIYSIPFRCLYSRNINNLLFAGRNISCSHVALGSTRVIATCAVLGQAAGAAAYLCLKYGATPRELHRNRIEELQQLLLKHDAYIIDLPNQDAGDLARNAKVVASSDAILEVASASGAPDGAGVHNLGALKNAWAPFDTDAALALHIPRGQQFPVGRGRIEAVELLLFSELSQTDVLEAELVKCRRVGDPRDVQPVARSSGEIPPRGWSWVPFPFDVVVGSEAVYDVRLPQAQGIAWGYSAHEPLGTQRTRWYEVFGRWDRVRGSHCFRVLPPARPYGGANIVSGVARPERSANCWISDPTQPLPQWVELHFANPVTFNTVYLTFDTNLDVLVSQGAAPECVRDYRLLWRATDDWRDLLTIKGNYQRRRTHQVERISAQALRLVIEATNGDPSARVYEIRLYLED